MSRGLPKAYVCPSCHKEFRPCSYCRNRGYVIGWKLECGDCDGRGYYNINPTHPNCTTCEGKGHVFVPEEAPR